MYPFKIHSHPGRSNTDRHKAHCRLSVLSGISFWLTDEHSESWCERVQTAGGKYAADVLIVDDLVLWSAASDAVHGCPDCPSEPVESLKFTDALLIECFSPIFMAFFALGASTVQNWDQTSFIFSMFEKKLVFFYLFIALLTSCRCGHCQSLTPDWKKAASALKVNTSPLLSLLFLVYLL